MNQFKLLAIVVTGIVSLSVAGATLAGAEIAVAQGSVDVCGQGTAPACENFVSKYINPFITLLTLVVGVAAAISIIVAGIQYASAAGDAGKVQKAKERIGQTLLGLLAYILLFSFLNFIIPGGLL